MVISVTADIRRTRRQLRREQRSQVPFAVSMALNNVAFGYRNEVVNRIYPRSFPNARNKRFPGVAFRVDKASKRRLVAAVYDRLDRYFFDYQIQGGAKKPRGTYVAVPTGDIKRTQSGKIGVNNQPRSLRNSFLVEDARGAIIYQRKGGKRNPRVKAAYFLRRQTQQRARFPFFREGRRYVRRNFNREFEKALKVALSTAR